MPNPASSQHPDFDFWDFVHCALCRLPFTPEPGAPPQVPFWITECGHVVCNNHLNADQTCPECGTKGIQLAPLQRDMDPPMSDWFRAAPQVIDTLAYSVRFQMETLASLVSYYKKKCSQQRGLLQRAQANAQEMNHLRKTVEALQSENQQLRDTLGYDQDQHQLSSAGKRRRMDLHYHVNGAQASSSPRSSTSAGPARLTLPASHHRPPFASRQLEDGQSHQLQAQNRVPDVETNRPGSSRFAEQYAYSMSVPNQSSVVTGLSHAQMQATYLAQRRPPENKQVPQAPLPSNVHLRRNEQGNSSSSSASSRIQMPPPIHLPNRQGSVSTHRSLASVNQTFSEQPLGIANPTPIQSNRFQPPSTTDSQHLKSAPHDRRFVPSAPVHRHMTPSGAGLGGSRAPSRSNNRTTSNHRIPFTPNAKLAFE